jgi:hypothetical protein
MNDLAKPKNKFNFDYSPIDYVDNIDTFFQLVKAYNIANPPQRTTIEQNLNLICEIDENRYMPLEYVKSKIPGEFLSNYLAPIFEEADGSGITSLMHFRAWVQGNHRELLYPCSQLDAHTHLDEDLQGTFTNDPIHTRTVIIPLQIENNITESFWANWIDDIPQTVTPKLKVLNSMNMDKVSKEITNSAFGEWWDKLKERVNTNELDIKFPSEKEKLTLDFNSRNYLHGIDNIGNNLYLIILFDRCKK